MASAKDTERLGAILLKANLIDEMQLKSATAKLGNWGGRLPKVLAEMGMIDESEATVAIGKAHSTPVVHLGTVLKDSHAMAKLDVKFCELHAVFPVSLKDRLMSVAVVDPSELDVIDAVKARCGGRVQIVLASETEIRHAIMRHYRGQEPKVVSNRARKAVTREMSTNDDVKFEVDMAPPPPKPRTTQESLRKSAAVAFTQEDLAKLEAARVNQSKTATILRAVQELLTEKGLIPPR
jgi:hypothetical protein